MYKNNKVSFLLVNEMLRRNIFYLVIYYLMLLFVIIMDCKRVDRNTFYIKLVNASY